MTQKIKFDDVIEILGGFGTYQKRLYLLIVVPTFFVAITTFITVFTLGDQAYRCKLPGSMNNSNQSTSTEPDETCTRSINETTNSTEMCTDWVYDRSMYEETLVSEYDLVCHRTILQSHAYMGLFAGAFVGSAFFGTLGDKFGRKLAICLSLMLMLTGHVGTALSPNYITFVIMRVIGGIGNIGYWNSAIILGFEIAGPKKRVLTGMLIELVWVLGEYATVLVAYFVRKWRTLQLIFSIPLIVFLIYWKFLVESPRWLLNHGDQKAGMKILSNIARVNKSDINKLDGVEIAADKKMKESIIKTMKKLVTSKMMISRTLILLLNWFTVNIGYFGLTLNTGKIGGNVFINFTTSATMELAAYFICLAFLDRVGRRLLHSACMLIGGIACLSTILPVLYGDSSNQWITITLSMIGKLGISAAFADIFFLSAELFPTSVRNLTLGISSICGRFGSLLSPYIANLALLVPGSFGKALPLIIFGSLMLASGILTLFLPETMNQKMPETIEDAIALKRQKNSDENDEELTRDFIQKRFENVN